MKPAPPLPPGPGEPPSGPSTGVCVEERPGGARRPTHLAHGLRDPKPAAASGQAHRGLQADLVAHGDIERLGAAVVALQGLGRGRQRQSTVGTSSGGFRLTTCAGTGGARAAQRSPRHSGGRRGERRRARPGPVGVAGEVDRVSCTRAGSRMSAGAVSAGRRPPAAHHAQHGPRASHQRE